VTVELRPDYRHPCSYSRRGNNYSRHTGIRRRYRCHYIVDALEKYFGRLQPEPESGTIYQP